MDNNRKDFFRELAQRVSELVINEQLFLDCRLSLDDVANRLEVSRYYVSHAINNYLGKSFHTFVNELRIEEAARIMGQERGELKVTDVFRHAGFTDRTSFHRVCKQVTGISPSELREKLNK